MSMSTQVMNLSERGSALNNLASQHSAREVGSIGGVKKYPGGAAGGQPDLLPIDEDVDDEKCSPLKPKRRTSDDSPFKKHLAAARRDQDGNYEKPLTISSVDVDDDDIRVGGFGLELDKRESNEHG